MRRTKRSSIHAHAFASWTGGLHRLHPGHNSSIVRGQIAKPWTDKHGIHHVSHNFVPPSGLGSVRFSADFCSRPDYSSGFIINSHNFVRSWTLVFQAATCVGFDVPCKNLVLIQRQQQQWNAIGQPLPEIPRKEEGRHLSKEAAIPLHVGLLCAARVRTN